MTKGGSKGGLIRVYRDRCSLGPFHHLTLIIPLSHWSRLLWSSLVISACATSFFCHHRCLSVHLPSGPFSWHPALGLVTQNRDLRGPLRRPPEGLSLPPELGLLLKPLRAATHRHLTPQSAGAGSPRQLRAPSRSLPVLWLPLPAARPGSEPWT